MRRAGQICFLLCSTGLLIGLVLALQSRSKNFAGDAVNPPWETWEDLHRLPEIHDGQQVLLRSSHCPDGCRYDRHSAGDWRYLYVDGEEGVIFEEVGAGAITRIWMTMGMGVSVPLDPEIRLRIYVDGATTPAVDAPLPALFDGSNPPFVPPLVGDRLTSSGGNFSYVPIPYRDGCRVALVGAHERRIWYQINFHRLADSDGVASFTGREDLSSLQNLLATQGQDPWPTGSGTKTDGTVWLEPGEANRLLVLDGQGSVIALKLKLDAALWSEVVLHLSFDGETAVQMPLADFFAVGRVGPLPTRSLLIGLDETGFLYSYFPMPFFEAAELSLINHGSSSASVDFEIRHSDTVPSARSGIFGAVLSQDPATTTGVDFPLVSLSGRGKLVGTFVELGSTVGSNRDYLEGDERIFVDRSPHPVAYGTGVEDYFNGGFYFDQGPFSLALHGAPYTSLHSGRGLATTAAYRLMLTDGLTFQNNIVEGLEGGPNGDVSMRARAVSYFYRRETPGLFLSDSLDLGSEIDRDHHQYTVAGSHVFRELEALFECEPPVSAIGTGVYRPPGAATFTMRAHPMATRYRLRRRLDAGIAGQRAKVLVFGVPVGSFPPIDANEARRWREVDVDLSGRVESADTLVITVVVEPGPPVGDEDVFTAFRYELWTDHPPGEFAKDFELRNLSARN